MKFVSSAVILFLLSTVHVQAQAAERCLDRSLSTGAIIAACDEALSATAAPSDADAAQFLNDRGNARARRGNLEISVIDYLAAIELAPDLLAPRYNLVFSYFDLGNQTEAELWAQSIIDDAPGDPMSYEAQMNLRIEGPNPRDCLTLGESILSLMPEPEDWPAMDTENTFVVGSLGYCFELNEQNDLALSLYQAAAILDPEDAWTQSSIANIAFYQFARDQLALEAATRAVALDGPNDVLVHILAVTNVNLGQLDEAIAVVDAYGDFINVGDNDLGTRNHLAWNLFLLDRQQEASQVIEPWADWAADQTRRGNEIAGNVWDTVAHVRAAVGDRLGAGLAWQSAFELHEDRAESRRVYRSGLAALGIEVARGDDGLRAALNECAAMGAACRLVPEDREIETR